MTLPRQLFIGLSLIFAFLVLGIETIFVQNARHYLQQQLEAHAQETATSLALSLGRGMQEPDPVLAKTLINPVFDRGNFASIRFLGVDGRPLIARDLGNVPDEVPALFTRLLPLVAPTGEALVSSGWLQLGRVLVVVHPRIAYDQLWHTALETLAWLVALYVCALFATRRYLSGILRPLEAIEQAALAIGRREFGEVHLHARAPELQRVGMAMNDLSEKMRIALTPKVNAAEIAKPGHVVQRVLAGFIGQVEPVTEPSPRHQCLHARQKYRLAGRSTMHLESFSRRECHLRNKRLPFASLTSTTQRGTCTSSFRSMAPTAELAVEKADESLCRGAHIS